MLFLSILSLLSFSFSSALQISSCIKYETQIVTQYQMVPMHFSDSWFSNRFHYSPKIITRLVIRSKRLLGCCESGYQYTSWPVYGCQPYCLGGCPRNSKCSAPNQCTCDFGYFKSETGSVCLSNDTLTTYSEITSTTPKIPCNGSCQKNEICSEIDDECVCAHGYQRLNDTNECVPKCEDNCQNAYCTAPNTCSCWPDYESFNGTTCYQKCNDVSCVFGECNKNGVCACAEGFINNGTTCLWAGNDVFSEPDDCECWSKFIWQKNLTENRCSHSCEDSELSADCLSSNECVFYEGITVCGKQIYKCVDVSSVLSTSTVVLLGIADEMGTKTVEHVSSRIAIPKAPFLGFILVVVVVVGVSLWFWKVRRNQFDHVGNYNSMESGNSAQQQQDEEEF